MVKLTGMKSYGCWIGGRMTAPRRLMPVVNPASEETFAQVSTADEDTIDHAVGSAQQALASWRRTPTGERAALLRRLAQALRDEADAFAERLALEVGKPLPAARAEALNSADLIDYFAEESIRMNGAIPLLNQPSEEVLVVREPIGVVVAITPFNYPLSTLICKLGPALATGCTMVAKPDEHTPLATLELARLASQCGLPDGVFNVVSGPGPGAGRALVRHPVPRLVAFTGSTQVGKEILHTNAALVRKALLELGGHCPAIICDDARWREVLDQIVNQCFKNSGQYCYRISRLYVARSLYSEFVEAFADKTAQLQVGDPFDPQVDLGPVNNMSVLTKLRTQMAQLQGAGAQILFRSTAHENFTQGYFFAPVVLGGEGLHETLFQEEIFGPVVIVTPFDTVEEAIELANGTPYGLAGYLFTENLGNALHWSRRLEVGSLWVNRIHQAFRQAPFGGMKESGLGREKSRFGLEEYTELKTVYLSY